MIHLKFQNRNPMLLASFQKRISQLIAYVTREGVDTHWNLEPQIEMHAKWDLWALKKTPRIFFS
jgi:hypothetical protein